MKGIGGRSYANEYYLHLPKSIDEKGGDAAESSSRETTDAVVGKRLMQYSPDEQCISREATARNKIINNNKKKLVKIEPSSPDTDDVFVDNLIEGNVADLGKLFKCYGGSGESARGEWSKYNRMQSPIEKAMAICGVNDPDNKRVFGRYMCEIGQSKSDDIVDTFISEIRQGEHAELDSKKRCKVLMSMLKDALPPSTKLPDSITSVYGS